MKNTLKNTLLLTVATTTSVHANVLFTDNFESGTAGETLSGNGWEVISADSNRSVDYTTDDGSFFGASNQYISLIDNASGGSLRFRQSDLANATALAKLSFDFHDPSADSTDSIFLQIGNNSVSSNTDRVAQLVWDPANGGAGNGSFGTGGHEGVYSFDTTYSVIIFANNTSSTANYTMNGAQSVASQHYDIWFNGSLLVDEAVYTNGSIAADAILDSFEFVIFTSATQDIFIDNVEFSNSFAAVPEPSTILLVSMTSLGALLLLRRRNK